MEVGTRIKLRHDVDRYPHFVVESGATGTVTQIDDEVFIVKIDEHVPGAEDWDNEIVWSLYDGDDPLRDIEELEPELECLDAPRGGCSGEVRYRTALSATGRSFPRCEKHWSARLDEQERINRDYPDSPIPPAWFDPAAAGETWDEEY